MYFQKPLGQDHQSSVISLSFSAPPPIGPPLSPFPSLRILIKRFYPTLLHLVKIYWIMSEQPSFTGDPNSHDLAKFKDGMTAACLCGGIQVTIKDSELFTKKRGHLCHCSNCRKVAGSFVSSNLAIEKEKVVVEDPKGIMKRYKDYATASGKCVERCFCGNCGK